MDLLLKQRIQVQKKVSENIWGDAIYGEIITFSDVNIERFPLFETVNGKRVINYAATAIIYSSVSCDLSVFLVNIVGAQVIDEAHHIYYVCSVESLKDEQDRVLKVKLNLNERRQ